MSLYSAQRFRASLRHFLVGRAAQGVVSIVFTLAAVRAMNGLDYGAYMVLVGLVDLFRPLSSLGLLQTVQQYLPEMALHAGQAQLRAFVRWTRLIRWALLGTVTVALYLVWTPVATWLGLQTVTLPPAWLPCAMIAGLLAAEFAEHMLEALLDQKTAQLLRLLYGVGRLAALLVLAWQGPVSLGSMLLIEVAAAGACWLASELALWRSVRRILPDGSRRFATRELVRFTWMMAGSQVLNAFSSGGAFRLVVARLLGLEAAGLFGFLHTLMGQLNRMLPATMLANLIRPMLIARRVQGRSDQVADACALLWRTNFLCLWPLVPVVYGGRDWFVATLSGLPTADGLVFTGMFVALISMTQAQVNAIILQVHKRSGDIVRASTVSILAPPLVAVGAAVSLAGAAFGLFLAYAVRSAATTWMIQRSSARMALDSRRMAAYGAGVAAAGAAGLVVLAHAPWPAALATYGALLLALVAFVKPLNAADADIIGGVLGRRFAWIRWLTASGGR